MAYARHEAAMNAPAKTGGTQRAHLMKSAQKKGPFGDKARAALNGPAFPVALTYLWDWFCELAGGRRYAETGAVPLSWLDLDAWARLTDRHLEPREVSAIFALDRTTLSVSNG